ncbi:VanZ family protein [Apilactobacillus quenuiae]|uniref:VanZ family protein n=1 Tax=Apilactobacillus quenuiae TaxID=2008377 RepID=UPI000D021CBC|nr:VanZ family protein [Apilactobacillus quenuiae]
MISVDGKPYFGNMISSEIILIPMLLLLFFMMFILIKRRKLNVLNGITLVMFFIYLYNLISMTIFPINIFNSSNLIHNISFGKQTMFNFNVMDMFNYLPIQIWGNILLTFPLAIFLNSLFPNKFHGWYINIIVGFLSTLLIETSQLILNYFYLGYRVFDVNDIILNFIGYILGLIIYIIIKFIFSRKIKFLSITK